MIDERRTNSGEGEREKGGEGWVVYAKVRGGRGGTRNEEQVECRLKRTCCTRLKK